MVDREVLKQNYSGCPNILKFIGILASDPDGRETLEKLAAASEKDLAEIGETVQSLDEFIGLLVIEGMDRVKRGQPWGEGVRHVKNGESVL